MPTLLRSVIGSMLFLSLVSASFAQVSQAANAQPPALTITAFASSERVRFAAPASIVQIRLEVYDSAGQKLYDNELRGGNVLDWHLQDGQATRLPNDTYLCVVTVKSRSGRLTQRIGSVLVEQGSASVQAAAASQLTVQQTAAIGPVEDHASLSVVKEDAAQTTTVLAHNGEEGQLVRGRGALSFRLGDFFSGKDSEQMRLTAEGKLGLGVADPQAKLDVAGPIRTSEGIVFPDGTVQTTAYVASGRNLSSLSEQSSLQRDSTGRSLAELSEPAQKNSAGGLTPPVKTNIPDDLVVNGNLIFTPAGARDINMQNNSGGLRFYGAPALTTSPAAAAIQFWGNGSGFPGQLYLDAGAHDSGALIFRTAQTGATITERMRVTANGNVGIGTTSPLSKLTVQGTGYGMTHTSGAGAGAVTVGTFITTAAGGSPWFGTKSNHPLNFFTNDSLPQMTIDTSGNVGIGVSPTTKLSVLNTTAGVSAIYGESATAPGVYGKSTSSRGVFGESDSFVGVWGKSATNGGVLGESNSGSGVFGRSAAVSLTAGGVYGLGTASGSIGVIGESNLGFGVGVFGVSGSPDGYGGYFRNNGGGNALIAEGTARVGVLEIYGGSDLAEKFEVTDETKTGMVVAIDPKNAGRLIVSRSTYNRRVAGIISGANNLSAGMVLPNLAETGDAMTLPVALTGRVWVYCDATKNAIRPGDLLTTSATPGHAMKVVNRARAQGAIIGKAMTELKVGKGLVLVLVSLQ